MKKTVRKWFWVWQQEKEKAFLEGMSSEGYRLIHVGIGKYTFEKSEPEKLIYQMDFRCLDGKISEEEYLQIYEDAGWELADKHGSWYYFRRQQEEGIDLSIFNDNGSKSAVYKRLLLFLLIIGFPLYYQNIIMFPNMPDSKMEFPTFYFFFRMISLIITLLHLSAVIKLYTMYRKLKNSIKE